MGNVKLKITIELFVPNSLYYEVAMYPALVTCLHNALVLAIVGEHTFVEIILTDINFGPSRKKLSALPYYF